VAAAGDFDSERLDWLEEFAERQEANAERTIATIPGLSLAVQAFLFSVGLGPNTSGAGRVSVAIVGLVSALVTYQATSRQNERRTTYYETVHTHRAERHAQEVRYDALRKRYNAQTADRRFRTVSYWLVMVGVFILLDVFVFVAGVLQLAGIASILSP
jgi:hypothetical protein